MHAAPSPPHAVDAANATLLGEGMYDAAGPQTQAFPAAGGGSQAFSHAALEVLDNHGERDFTCIYRFRVHGEVPPTVGA